MNVQAVSFGAVLLAFGSGLVAPIMFPAERGRRSRLIPRIYERFGSSCLGLSWLEEDCYAIPRISGCGV
jgi:hypothetical protein